MHTLITLALFKHFLWLSHLIGDNEICFIKQGGNKTS